jgi:hypothetical protein
MAKQTKHHKKRTLSKNHRRTARKRRGGCSCQNNNLPNPLSLFSGGNAVVLGTTQDFTQLSDKNYYSLNAENVTPNYTAIASRQTDNFLVKGGKKGQRKSRSRGKKPVKYSRRVAEGIRGNSGERSSEEFRGGSNILNNALSYTMVGSNDFSDTNTGNNFFSQPYDRYTVENPPRA